MSEITTSLPIAPRETPSFGYLSTLLAVSIFSKLDNSESVYGLNLLGSKQMKEESINKHLKLISELDSENSLVLKDTDPENFEIINTVFATGIQNGWIQKQLVRIVSCSCGKCQYLKGSQNYGARSLVQNQKCKICNTKLQEHS